MPMTTRIVSFCSMAGLVLAVLAAPSLQAADKAREGSFGKGKPVGLLLTPAELRDCLARQDRLRDGGEQSVKDQAALTANKAEIDRLGVVLKDQLAALDRTSAEAVAAYNAQVEARDKLIDAYEAGVPAFNARVEALKAERSEFAKTCENRRYDEADEATIRKAN
jgi:hypothetical protein